MKSNPSTVIFWGAGATADLGMRMTAQQAKFIQWLTGSTDQKCSIEERVYGALDNPTGKVANQWHQALIDLLVILGDGESDLYAVSEAALLAMRRNWESSATDERLRQRIHALRSLFDWPALKAITRVCPGTQKMGKLKISDLFNVIDMHSQSGHGFNTGADGFLTPQRIIAAKSALQMILHAMFYIDYQQYLSTPPDIAGSYFEFAEVLARRMLKFGIDADSDSIGKRSFYMGDVTFVSLNYDPIGLWTQFVVHHELNNSPSVPHIGTPAMPLKLFHDLGHFMACKKVDDEQGRKESVWYPMNESAAQRLNDPDHQTGRRVRLVKYLFPHGCLCWRECPNCGKLTSYFGDTWKRYSSSLIPPPPLRAFALASRVGVAGCDSKEKEEIERGAIDARACVHCGTLTFAQHTRTLMQSNFKGVIPPSIEEIQRDLRVMVQKADHIILFGYTLPPDDVTYRAFFAARRRFDESGKQSVRCSVVVGKKWEKRWLYPDELEREKGIDESPRATITAAQDIFGKQNVRFYGGGIPAVLLDGKHVTSDAVENLLVWKRDVS